MTRTCTICAQEFEPKFSTLQVVCGIKCARRVPIVQRKQAACDRRETKAKLTLLKTRSQWLKDAQTQVNRYVRLRDAGKGCISCDKPASWAGQWHASHLRSVGAASAVRFNLWNIHKACSPCNHHLSGNIAEYEPRLREKIGNDKVGWLRAQNQLVSYSVDYLARLKRVFAKKSARLEKRMR